MNKNHHYQLTLKWTGNRETGTSGYRDYDRSYTIAIEKKADISGSSDPAFRGDETKHNPEELFLSAISSCHMLWYLHFCASEGVIVTGYTDHATAIMAETSDGSGKFTEITLHPVVTIKEISMSEKAKALHQKANQFCFIANTLNVPVHHHPTCKIIE